MSWFGYNTKQILDNNDKKIKEMLANYQYQSNKRFDLIDSKLNIIENKLYKPFSMKSEDIVACVFAISVVGACCFAGYMDLKR